MSECGKYKSSRIDGLVRCEGIGKKRFQSTYVGSSEAEFSLFEKNKNVLFFCNFFKIFTEVVNIFLAEIINKTYPEFLR